MGIYMAHIISGSVAVDLLRLLLVADFDARLPGLLETNN